MRILISIQHPVGAWQIPPAAVARLREWFPDVTFVHATDDATRAAALPECDVAFTWFMTAEEAAAAAKLRWVHTSAVAVETFALAELFARGVIVSNSRGVQSHPIAEHVFAMLLALARRLPLALERQRERRWAQQEFAGEHLPWLLRGRTLGLVGVGTIGSEVARRAAAFGMHTIAVRRRIEAGAPEGVHEVFPPEQLGVLLERADVVVISAPLTPETATLIGPAELKRMKLGAVLINVGRGQIVDQKALVSALQSGHLGGAALDVFHQEPLPPDDPLWTAPNVILTPHTSGFRQGHWDDVIELFAENLRRFRRGEPVRFRVDPVLGY